MTSALRPFPVPVIGIAGWKNSGKTTLACRLIDELTGRGHRVASIKHAHHAFSIDDGETDSARHRRAGSRQVAIVSSRRWAIVSELDGAPEPDLAEVVARLEPCDIVVIEGYKSAAIPKIEARREAAADRSALAASDPLVVAIASDRLPAATESASSGPPHYLLDDIAGLADLVTSKLGPLARSLAIVPPGAAR